jgi:hypothetical protein
LGTIAIPGSSVIDAGRGNDTTFPLAVTRALDDV